MKKKKRCDGIFKQVVLGDVGDEENEKKVNDGKVFLFNVYY